MNEQIAKQTFSPDGKFTYSFWTEGNKKNPTLVIIPGFTGTHSDLLEFARQFKNEHFVILPDLPGWGDSPKGSYHLTIHGYATFVHDLLTHLSQKEIILIGHCMGSTVAIEFAYCFPKLVKELFLIGVPYMRGSMSDELFAHLAHSSQKVPKILRPLFFLFRSRIIAIPLGFFVVQTRSIKKKLRIVLSNAIKQQFQDEESVEKNWNSLVLFNYKKLHAPPMPIHIFHGEKDVLIPASQAEKLLEINPKATFAIIPHAGHMPPVETPVALAHEIQSFLTK